MISLECSQKHKFSPSHQLSYPTVCWVMLYLNQYKEVMTKVANVKTEWNMNSNTKLHCPIQQPLALKWPLDTCGYLDLIKNLTHWLYQLNLSVQQLVATVLNGQIKNISTKGESSHDCPDIHLYRKRPIFHFKTGLLALSWW